MNDVPVIGPSVTWAFPTNDAQWWLRKQRPTQFNSNKNRPKGETRMEKYEPTVKS